MSKINTKIALLSLFFAMALYAQGAHAQYDYGSSPAPSAAPSSPAPAAAPVSSGDTPIPFGDSSNPAATGVSDPGMPTTGAGGDIAVNILFGSALVTSASGLYLMLRPEKRRGKIV